MLTPLHSVHKGDWLWSFQHLRPHGSQSTVTVDSSRIVWLQEGKPHDATVTRYLSDDGQEMIEVRLRRAPGLQLRLHAEMKCLLGVS